MADLNNATYWSEVDASNNSASPNGWPEGMMPSGVNDAARSDKGALKRFWDRINPLNQIAPAGGVWTFTTSNPSYPVAYAEGEIYSFRATTTCAANDQFRVNALPAKPIQVIRNYTFDAIKPYDIIGSGRPILTYDSTLASGAGAFLLLNPQSPVSSDGAGGATMPGPLTVSGALTTGAISATGNITASGNLSAGSGYLVLNNQTIMVAPAANTSYTTIYDNSAGTALLLGGTAEPTSYYRNTGHRFADRAGTTFMTISAGSVSVTGNLSATGTLSGGALTVPSITLGGTLTAATVTATGGITANTGNFSGPVTLTGGGANVLNVPNGGITTGYNITANTGNFSGSVTLTGGGANVLNVTGGGITATYNVTAGTDVICNQGYKPGGGSWQATSDVRTKEAASIADYTTGLDALMQLRPISYRYNGRGGTPRDGRTFIGLTADDVLPIMPEMVGRITERLDPDDTEPTDILTLDATALTFALLNAVRTLAADVESLKTGEPDAATRPTPQPRPHRRGD